MLFVGVVSIVRFDKSAPHAHPTTPLFITSVESLLSTNAKALLPISMLRNNGRSTPSAKRRETTLKCDASTEFHRSASNNNRPQCGNVLVSHDPSNPTLQLKRCSSKTVRSNLHLFQYGYARNLNHVKTRKGVIGDHHTLQRGTLPHV